MTTTDAQSPRTRARKTTGASKAKAKPVEPVDTQETPEVAAAPDPRRWIALAIMLVAAFMDMLDASVVNVAIPTIQRDLGATYGAIQWITAGYVMAFALLLITGGRLGDIYGRRKIFQLGVVGFTIASLVCGIAGDPGTLVVARLVQGAMAGLMVPQIISIIHVTFPNEEKGKAFAMHGIVGGLGATVAPLIGGVIVAANIFGWDWRPIFLINIPVGILGFLFGMKYIPESKAPSALKLDLVGVALATGALILLLYPLTFGRELGWPAWTYSAMVFSAVMVGWFLSWERHKAAKDGSPLLVMELFNARSFRSAQVLQLVFYTFTGMFFLAIYLFMQLGLGWSPLRAGLTILAFCIGAFITATLSVMVLVPKFGRTVLHAGAVVVALGLGLFLWLNATKAGDQTSWTMVAPLFLIGLGFSATATAIPMFGLADVPFKDAGSASGLLNTMQQLGFTLGIAIVSLAFFAPISSNAQQSVDEIAPSMRQELVTVGLTSTQADTVVADFRNCEVAQLSTAAEGGAGCTTVQGNTGASAVLAKYAEETRGNTFAGSFQVALFTALGLILLVFLAVGGLPKQVQGPPAG